MFELLLNSYVVFKGKGTRKNMLLNVNVKNLALIEQADVYFGEGMNIMTGETGAGKSIIIGSILLALGGKLPKDMLREEGKEALVELVFQVTDADTIEALEALGVSMEEDGQVIISRRIVNGKSLIRVNGESYTVANLKKVTEQLIDIHGQHDHQSLLKTSKHLEILDKFAENAVAEIKQELKEHYGVWKDLKKSLTLLELDEETRARELSFCQYEIDEITNANLKKGEYEEIESQFKKLSSSGQLLSTMNEIYALTGGENGQSVSEQIGRASSLIQGVLSLDEQLQDIATAIGDLEGICYDINRSLKDYVENLTYDPAYAKELEDRMDLLNSLRQKYAGYAAPEEVIDKILEYGEKQQQKLDTLLHMEEERQQVVEKIQKEEVLLQKLSDKLTDIRKKEGRQLEEKIIAVLQGLNFLDVKFEIQFNKKAEFHENGMDEIEFMISTNPGEALRPLIKIASGGELSRIMLGIKTILASKDKIDTLIFDEIDTGISGKTAQLVAERMKELSRCHQIICITHLPQIAAMADSHYLIQKSVVDEKTHTGITHLSEEDSVQELARMLSGSEITTAVLENARELKKMNRKI